MAALLAGSLGLVYWRYQQVGLPSTTLLLLLLAGWLTAFTLAAWGAGIWLVRRLAPGGLPRPLHGLLQLALGTAALAMAAGVLAAAGILAVWGLGVVLLLAVLVGLASFKSWVPWRCSRTRKGRTALALVPLALVLPAVAALSPFYDQWNYHLGLPFQWLQARSLVVFPRHAFTYLPATASLLYTYPLAFLGPWGAQALHWLAAVFLVLAAGSLAYRLRGPRAALLTSAVLGTAPVVLESATWAGADLFAAAFALAAWLPIFARGDLGPRAWLASGALAGAACGSKLLGLATVLPPLVVAALSLPRPLTEKLRALASLALGSLATFGPWLVRNLWLTGDPFYPFGSWLMAQLGGAANPTARLATGLMGGEVSARDPLAALTLSTFAPKGFAGEVGPMFLALLPLALAATATRRDRRLPVLLAASAAGVLGWAAGPTRARYLLPVLPLLAVTCGCGWVLLRRQLSPVLRRVFSWSLAFGLLWSAERGLKETWWLQQGSALGFLPTDALAQRYVSYWGALRWVNEELPPEAKVVLVAEARLFGWERPILAEDPFHQPLLTELAMRNSTPEGMRDALEAMGVTHLLVNWAEAARMATMNGRQDYFSDDPTIRQQVHTFLATYAQAWREERPVTLYRLRRREGP